MTPELSRPVVLSTIPATGRRIAVAATEAERAALAKRLELLALGRLEAEAEILPEPGMSDTYRVRGRLRAAVTQACVVTLEPVPQEIDEPLDWRIVPAAAGPEGEEEFVAGEDMAEGPEEVEAEGGVLDLGEALAQQLSLVLDPYPRAPGATLGPDGVGDPRSPFAALSRLRRDG